MRTGQGGLGKRLVGFNELAERGDAPQLLALLAGDDVRRSASLRGGVVAALGRTGDRRVEAILIRFATDENEDEDVRLFAIRGLRAFGSPESVRALSHLIVHKSHRIRAAAITSLGEVGDESAAQPLIELLEHDEWLMRARAAEAVGKVGANRAVPALITCLQDPKRIVRVRAAQALAVVGDETALKPLAKARNRDWSMTRLLMTRALRALRNRVGTEH